MRRVLAVTAALLCVWASSVRADLCAGVSTTGPTVSKWTGKCKDLATDGTAASCWDGGLPTASSTVVIPSGTTAGMQLVSSNAELPTLFDLFSVQNFVIEHGATVTMDGNAIQTTGCLLVQGTLILNGTVPRFSDNVTNQAPRENYLPDPSQPEGTDCATVMVGFTPRLCGPGKLSVSGTIVVGGLFASVFQEGAITETGVFEMIDGGFFWGNLTNQGAFTSTGYTYQHGFLYNFGTANMTTVAYDVWSTTYRPNAIPLLVENHGSLVCNDAYLTPTYAWYGDSTTGAYRAILVNYGATMFIGYGGQTNWEFDLFNYGELTWNYTYQYNFFGGGTFVNKGAITVYSALVFLSSFHSVGGSITLLNGGIINFGSSSSAASATMKLCQLASGMPSNLQAAFERNSRRRILASRHVGQSSNIAVEQRGDCWWYGDFCYHSPYLWSPPIDAQSIIEVAPRSVHPTGLPLHRHAGSVRLRVQELIADSQLSLDTPCQVRYSFDETSVHGDGSGSIVANLPVKIVSKLALRAGAKWYVAAERKAAPFYGGGQVIVHRGATLFAGISAEFKHDGAVEVMRGGQFAVPRHAAVIFSNHTFRVRHGAKLHVDGQLTFAEAKGAQVTIEQCGIVDGVGEVVVTREGALSCTADRQRRVDNRPLRGRRH